MTGLPLHPTLVHFPIAFYFLELVLLIFWKMRSDESYLRFADFSFAAGYVSMIAAVLTGWLDAGGDFTKIVNGIVASHFYAALAVLIFFTARGLYFRLAGTGARQSAAMRISASFIGNALTFYAAYWGGRLVYL